MNARSKPIVSIVMATFQRLALLQRSLRAIRANVRVSHELVIVGGDEGDGTAEWLSRQADILFIHEQKREGCTRAYNRGFRAATGEYVMWLNDDSYPLPGSVEAAVEMIERPDLADVGLVAFYHNEHHAWNRLDSVERDGEAYSIYNVRGVPYANFGLLRRNLLASLGYLDEGYYFCGWDPDLALKVQREAKLRVVGCPGGLVHHEQVFDDRKKGDMDIAAADNARLFRKWGLPEKCSYPDPVPGYQKMIRERNVKPQFAAIE